MSLWKENFMKKILLVLILVITFSPGCKKTNVLPQSILGGWSWVSTSNDGAPGPLNPLTPLNSGFTQSISFTDTNWFFGKNSVIISSGTYTTSIAKNTLGENINQIHFYHLNSQTDSITYYKISKDSMIFSYDFSGTVGSGASVYIRTSL
jgi:hypothetical protein